MLIGLNFVVLARSFGYCAFSCNKLGPSHCILMHFCDTDVPGPCTDYYVNCGDAYASLSGRPCLRVHKHVGYSSFLFVSSAYCDQTCSAKINLKYGGRIDTNETSATRRPGNQVEVITHKTHAQYPTSQSSCGDSNVGVDGRLDNEHHRQSLNDAESSV
jgi:hypothetical protein